LCRRAIDHDEKVNMNATSTGASSRSVLITGGLGDIGSATALRLARDGHVVTVSDRVDPAEGRAAVDVLADREPEVRERLAYVQADVLDLGSITRAIESMRSLDVAIANAGIIQSAPFLDITPDSWQEHLDVNLTGAFHTAQIAARRFVEDSTPGLLLFTSSWVADVPWPEITAYSVTKAAMVMLARQAARELAAHGIRANVVAPGIVDAGMARVQRETEPQYAARATRVIPLGEFQSVEQVAGTFSYLCSPDADYMTGSTVLSDGGASLHAFD
jgi:NAD(P)-dependent dehydrogenase (short-subunit alcohol dehydrogenase family)